MFTSAEVMKTIIIALLLSLGVGTLVIFATT